MSNRFNKHIKDHVERHEYDVDPQEIWEGILAKEEPKPKSYLWLFLFPIAIGFIVTSSWLTHNDLLSKSDSLSTVIDKNQPNVVDQNANLPHLHTDSKKITALNEKPSTSKTPSLPNNKKIDQTISCLLYTSPSPRDRG